MPNATTIRDVLYDTSEFITKQLRDQVIKQGHHLTGSLEDSITGVVSGGGDLENLQGWAATYGVYVNAGVTSDRIPFSGTGKYSLWGTSEYIQGLVRFAQIRFGLSGKAALSAAFAIAKKHKKEGMPTLASYGYSSNGARRLFIDRTFGEYNSEIDKRVLNGVDAVVDITFHETKSETI